MFNFITQRYSKQGLWSLFLMCAFPLHVWTLILVFRDLSWTTERTNAWDALGLASYGLMFAFIESVAFFLIFTLLGFLVSTAWDRERRIALLTVLILILSLWAMISQLYFLANFQVPGSFIDAMAQTAHPLRNLYISLLALIIPTLMLPAWLALRSDKTLRFINALIERLSLLSAFYLFFDVVGLVIVIIRNIS